MTLAYDDYCRALAELRDLPGRVTASLDETRQTHVRADALAADAIAAAEAAASETMRTIEAQLAAARTALESLGKSGLIPPRIRPSGGTSAATRDDVFRAQQSLAVGVNQVRQVVQSEIKRIEAENARLARDAAERERLTREAAERASALAARRKRLIGLGVAASLVLVVLIVILAVSL